MCSSDLFPSHDTKDVVSVPKYEGHPKMRVCEYTVISEVTDVVRELDAVVYNGKDATVLAPDTEPESKFSDDKTAIPARKTLDTSYPQNILAYCEGYAAGNHDFAGSNAYGSSKDSPRGKSYGIGYDDGYYNHPSQVDVTQSCCCGCSDGCDLRDCSSDCDCSEDNDYNDGYDCGYKDARNACYFQENLPIDASDEFKGIS